GDSTTAYFRYASADPGACNNVFGTATSSSFLGSGTMPLSSSRTLAALLPGTTYWYCAIAFNSFGTVYGAVLTFTTNPAAPLALTGGVTGLTNTAATLNGNGNPEGDATTAWFRYSTTNPGACSDVFGTRAPASGGTALG